MGLSSASLVSAAAALERIYPVAAPAELYQSVKGTRSSASVSNVPKPLAARAHHARAALNKYPSSGLGGLASPFGTLVLAILVVPGFTALAGLALTRSVR